MTPDDLLFIVGAQLDHARKRAKLNQNELAARASVSSSTVSHAMRCGDIRLGTLARLAEAAGCRVVITLEPE